MNILSLRPSYNPSNEIEAQLFIRAYRTRRAEEFEAFALANFKPARVPRASAKKIPQAVKDLAKTLGVSAAALMKMREQS